MFVNISIRMGCVVYRHWCARHVACYLDRAGTSSYLN